MTEALSEKSTGVGTSPGSGTELSSLIVLYVCKRKFQREAEDSKYPFKPIIPRM